MRIMYLSKKIAMLLEQQIREVHQYQKEYFKESSKGQERNLLNKIDLTDNHIKIITGIRRSGKSTLLMQLLSKTNHFNFLSFEDPRLAGFDVNDFFKLERIFQSNNDSNIYFFDEIQNIKGWEQFVRTLHDKKIRVIISGSNASLLSKELGTSLTGRQLTYELYPFSFEEFLRFNKYEPEILSFQKYIELGGLPEYLKSKNIDILIQLFNDLVYRDIVVRYQLRNANIVRDLGVYLASNVGKEFSYNKLANTFELGSANTLKSYISYFCDAYLFFIIPRFSYSLKQQAKNQKKIYGIDTGLMTSLSLSFSKDKGRILENTVFIELKRRKKEIYYYKKKKECDFIVSNKKKIESIIQVCYELNADNLERELSGLKEAMNDLGHNNGLILTLNQDEQLSDNNYNIIVKPVWKWLLEKPLNKKSTSKL